MYCRESYLNYVFKFLAGKNRIIMKYRKLFPFKNPHCTFVFVHVCSNSWYCFIGTSRTLRDYARPLIRFLRDLLKF